MTTKKITRIEALELHDSLLFLKQKQTPLSWAITRTLPSTTKNLTQWSGELTSLINLYAKKDENNKPILKEGTNGSHIGDFFFEENSQEVSDNIKKMQQEVIDIEVYEAPKEKIIEYLTMNPAPVEYEKLLGNIIDTSLID